MSTNHNNNNNNNNHNSNTSRTTSMNKSKLIQPNFIDLKTNYDYALLKQFYDELMVPNFPKEEELEPLENWVEMFNEQNIDNNSNESLPLFQDPFKSLIEGGVIKNEENTKFSKEVSFHIVLAINPNHDDQQQQQQQKRSKIMGGVVFEYYPSINCGCVTYLLVNTDYRGQGLAGVLLEQSQHQLMLDGKSRGHLGGCNVIFLETNSAEKIKKEDDVMDPAQRHIIFYKLGIRLLDFDYVQPPLSKESGKCRDLLLTCLLTNNIPKYYLGKEERYYLPSSLLKNFVQVFWDSCCSRLDMGDWERDVDYQRMMDQIDRRERIPLLDLPWERPWTLVDLCDSSSSIVSQKPMISKFYHEILVPNFSRNHLVDLEPLENWFNMLSGQQKKNSTEDFHLLVALRYPENDDSIQEPTICGGISFEYHKTTNCGLITYVLVGGGPNNRAERMSRALIQRAVDILEQNAIEFGHLAGCNAIFLETGIHDDEVVDESFESMDKIVEISFKQQFLSNMGWKKVDMDYFQPPLTIDKGPSKLNLTILLTPRIPQLDSRVSTKETHYLPSQLLINFLGSFWKSTCLKTGFWYEQNNLYRKMMDSLSRRKRIPLLGLPWKKPFVFVDMSKDFHEDLFNHFYNALPSTTGHRKTFDQLKESLQTLDKDQEQHVVLAISYLNQSFLPSILGAVVFSYFKKSNCGLVSDLLIKSMRTKDDNLLEQWDIAGELLEQAVEVINDSARKTSISGANAIFLESGIQDQDQEFIIDIHSSTNTLQISNKFVPVSYSTTRQNQGWLPLDFDYKPNDNNPRNFLCVYNSSRLPTNINNSTNVKQSYIPRDLLQNFLTNYWSSTALSFSNLKGDNQNYILKVIENMRLNDKILLLQSNKSNL
ncbi:hypothetical protein CYY_006473 [Polysphondylium violaceum]|uniref:Uncharacterized protein n=1 Tax=Polysphondylium violaceum TaxID=133409 RepID=A0A8J4PQU2_9MYCE|nr:hypothetical protein CYY_006473 [Polysphondylium violaceum]